MKKVMDRMSSQDYQQINSKLFDSASPRNFNLFYKHATSEGVGESLKDEELRKAWQKKANVAPSVLRSNTGVDAYMKKRNADPSAPFTVPNWPI